MYWPYIKRDPDPKAPVLRLCCPLLLSNFGLDIDHSHSRVANYELVLLAGDGEQERDGWIDKLLLVRKTREPLEIGAYLHAARDAHAQEHRPPATHSILEGNPRLPRR